jgi:hypothetical protein
MGTLMKTIQLDEAVFAAVWSRFQPGDKSENEILRRVFGLHSQQAPSEPTSELRSDAGYVDRRTGIVFPSGFEIFRTYKKQVFKAVAENGLWRLQDGRTAPSLNQLSMLIGATTENAWTGWNYHDGTQAKLINNLRDSKVAPRS